ncbi:hypothetical protein J1C48_05145 [Jiella sp. CQZ9-1]|uniref:Uncharacterized protein n=1 Tax=Jiella flava TaxID=2816857 RepID=A0A939JRI7_9HYPH|nr:hypothetical protein [Jiella flava]
MAEDGGPPAAIILRWRSPVTRRRPLSEENRTKTALLCLSPLRQSADRRRPNSVRRIDLLDDRQHTFVTIKICCPRHNNVSVTAFLDFQCVLVLSCAVALQGLPTRNGISPGAFQASAGAVRASV